MREFDIRFEEVLDKFSHKVGFLAFPLLLNVITFILKESESDVITTPLLREVSS
jgi:hypothetical protein